MTPLLLLDFDGMLHPAPADQSVPFSGAPLLVETLSGRNVVDGLLRCLDGLGRG